MTRRDLLAAGTAAATAALASRLEAAGLPVAEAAQGQMDMGGAAAKPIAMLLYPGFAALDLVGPNAWLAMHGNVRYVAKAMRPVRSDDGLVFQPTQTLASCPKDLDVLLVPGGDEGTLAAMRDEETLRFLRTRGARANHVASVCTGVALLGAAGLLEGRRATGHWMVRDLLPLFGATPVQERVVRDGRLWTAAGVTAGLDLGMAMVAELYGEEHAKLMQLAMEYDPKPPFHAGTPALAGHELTRQVRQRSKPFLDGVRNVAAKRKKGA